MGAQDLLLPVTEVNSFLTAGAHLSLCLLSLYIPLPPLLCPFLPPD